MLPGGGIGPELMTHVREIFGVIGVPVDFEIIDIDPNSEGNDDLDYAIMSIKRNGVALKGRYMNIEHFANFRHSSVDKTKNYIFLLFFILVVVVGVVVVSLQ